MDVSICSLPAVVYVAEEIPPVAGSALFSIAVGEENYNNQLQMKFMLL